MTRGRQLPKPRSPRSPGGPGPSVPRRAPCPRPGEGLGAGTREATALLALHTRPAQNIQGGRGLMTGPNAGKQPDR